MSMKQSSASRRNGRKMLRKASRKSAAKRRMKNTQPTAIDAIFEFIIQLVFCLILMYWAFSLLIY